MRAEWHRVKEIVAEAIEATDDTRLDIVRTRCGTDINLYNEVVDLLGAYSDSQAFLDQPIGNVSRLSEAYGLKDEIPEGPELLGHRVGPYRVVESIGEGGMGAVYLAERDDEIYEKRVAIKVLHRLHDRRARQRFSAERRILAQLTHPNIAGLIDGGITEQGYPYLVMDYVEGLPIDEYCQKHQLTVRHRLDLVLKVLDAVEFAHRNLVVHRDLKPTNILVDEDGEPKLLDFGIAKIVEAGDGTLSELTRTGSRWMTPEYASPEQIRNKAITTASDVYALGVLLFRLLTNVSPYGLVQDRYDLERAVCENPPMRPSSVLSHDGRSEEYNLPKDARRWLRGDLENVMLMAIRKEPERRYVSVRSFADDIRAVLAERPVVARRNSFGYTARKFVQRNRLGVGMAVVVMLAAAMGVATIIYQGQQVRTERDAAEELFGYMVSLFDVSDPEQSVDSTITAIELLDTGLTNAREKLSGQPEQRARVLNLLGSLYTKLGYYRRAETIHDDALSQLDGKKGGERLAEGYYRLGWALQAQGRYSEAEELYRDAISLYKELRLVETGMTAEVVHKLAEVMRFNGEYRAADSLVSESIRMRRSIDDIADQSLAESVALKALISSESGDHDEANRLFKYAIDLMDRSLGSGHLKTAYVINDYGLSLVEQRRYEEGEELIRSSLRTKLQHLGREHATVATSYNNLGMVLSRSGRLVEALEAYDLALEIRQRVLGSDNARTAQTKNNIALLLWRRGNLSGADSLYREAITTWVRVLGANHPKVAGGWYNLGWVLRDSGNMIGANEAFAKAVEIYRLHLPQLSLDLSNSLNALAKVAMAEREMDRAVTLFRECLEVREAVLPNGHWRIGTAHSLLGEVLLELEHFEEAHVHLQTGLNILAAARGEDDTKTKDARERLDRYLKETSSFAKQI